jgi:hypothetical protein
MYGAVVGLIGEACEVIEGAIVCIGEDEDVIGDEEAGRACWEGYPYGCVDGTDRVVSGADAG